MSLADHPVQLDAVPGMRGLDELRIGGAAALGILAGRDSLGHARRQHRPEESQPLLACAGDLVLLRQQVIILRRQVGRPALTPVDR